MPGELSLPIQEYPDYYKTAISAKPSPLTATAEFLFFTDQDVIIDAAGVWSDVLGTFTGGQLQIVYHAEGLDPLVVAATAVVSESFLDTTLVARTMSLIPINKAENLVPAYSTVSWQSSENYGDGTGNLVWVRYRTVQN